STKSVESNQEIPQSPYQPIRWSPELQNPVYFEPNELRPIWEASHHSHFGNQTTVTELICLDERALPTQENGWQPKLPPVYRFEAASERYMQRHRNSPVTANRTRNRSKVRAIVRARPAKIGVVRGASSLARIQRCRNRGCLTRTVEDRFLIQIRQCRLLVVRVRTGNN